MQKSVDAPSIRSYCNDGMEYGCACYAVGIQQKNDFSSVPFSSEIMSVMSSSCFFQLPTLTPYNEYCANQADAKEALDAVVSREARVRDFLQRCLESPFSRKLDLWSYLDLPRSRLVKYPLLLKAIHKVTPQDHRDAATLEDSVSYHKLPLPA